MDAGLVDLFQRQPLSSIVASSGNDRPGSVVHGVGLHSLEVQEESLLPGALSLPVLLSVIHPIGSQENHLERMGTCQIQIFHVDFDAGSSAYCYKLLLS